MSKTQKTKMISPKDAKDWKSLSNHSKAFAGWRMNVWDKDVTIFEKEMCILIPKRVLDVFVKFYTTPQKVKP